MHLKIMKLSSYKENCTSKKAKPLKFQKRRTRINPDEHKGKLIKYCCKQFYSQDKSYDKRKFHGKAATSPNDTRSGITLNFERHFNYQVQNLYIVTHPQEHCPFQEVQCPQGSYVFRI